MTISPLAATFVLLDNSDVPKAAMRAWMGQVETDIAAGGGGTPAGSAGYVQFNNAGAFGADVKFYWDNTNKRLGIGTSTPLGPMHTVTDGAGNLTLYDTYGGSSLQSVVRLRKASGSVSSPTATLDQDPLGSFQWAGHDGTAIVNRRADILCFAQGNWTGASNGAYFAFRTTPSGSVAIAERMRITDTGNVGINTTSPSTLLHVAGPIRCGSYTVGTLPSASAVGAGARAFVTDANSTTFHAAVAGGGANGVSVISDGTNWLIGG